MELRKFRHLPAGLLVETVRQMCAVRWHVPLGAPGPVQLDGHAQLDAHRREAAVEEGLVERAQGNAGGAEADDVHVGEEIRLGDGGVELEQGGLQIQQARTEEWSSSLTAFSLTFFSLKSLFLA